MMAAEAFADNQHDVWRAVAATVNLYLVGSMNELGNLMRSQLVGIDTELESVDWQIEYSMIFSVRICSTSPIVLPFMSLW